MLGLLGLRIFEATGADIADLGEEHGHRVLHVCGKGTKIVLLPLPPAVGRAIDQSIGTHARGPILLNSRGARMGPPRRHPPPAAPRRDCGCADHQAAPAHAPPYLRHDHAGRRRGLAGCPDRRPPRRSAHHDAFRQGPQEP
jgi:integrase